jgi:hypothetical protein
MGKTGRKIIEQESSKPMVESFFAVLWYIDKIGVYRTL